MAGPSGGVSGSTLTYLTPTFFPTGVTDGGALYGRPGRGGGALTVTLGSTAGTCLGGARTGGPCNEGTASDGAAALAEPAPAGVVRAAPAPVAGTTVRVKPFPCKAGSLMRMSFGGVDISARKQTAAQARKVQWGAERGGLEARLLRRNTFLKLTCICITIMSVYPSVNTVLIP